MRRLAAAIAFVTALLAICAAVSAAPSAINKARLDSTIRYLQEVQNADGGFGGDLGKESGQGFSAWVALALAAGGINPRCQAKPGGVDAYGFLAGHFQRGLEEEITWPQVPTTALERELMVVNASGTDPHAFAGHDLVGEILAREREDDGSFPYVPKGRGEINDTAFAILALAPIGEPAARAAIQRAADWLIGQQGDDGGWAWGVKGNPSEADLTGAAIQALRAAGRPSTEAERRGLQYLREMQNPDGGFPEHPGEAESNVASTAWAAQGIWASGEDPETWVEAGGREPLSYMASLQEQSGRLRWKASEDLNGVWMTAYAAPAFAGQTWPIPSSPCSPKPPSAPPQPGQGEGTQSGEGTIAGGGGEGAPLFSRPKPQSRGKTPGGARLVRSKNLEATNHSETRRGASARQPTGTETAEPSASQSEASAVPSSVGGSGGGVGGGSSGAGPGASGVGSSAAAGSGPQAPGPGTGPGGQPLSPALSGAIDRAQSGAAREVTGTLIGAASGQRGDLAFGAPGLHSAGVGNDDERWIAIGIGAAALLLVLAGAQLERRRSEVIL